jgi:hypothetical protein
VNLAAYPRLGLMQALSSAYELFLFGDGQYGSEVPVEMRVNRRVRGSL